MSVLSTACRTHKERFSRASCFFLKQPVNNIIPKRTCNLSSPRAQQTNTAGPKEPATFAQRDRPTACACAQTLLLSSLSLSHFFSLPAQGQKPQISFIIRRTPHNPPGTILLMYPSHRVPFRLYSVYSHTHEIMLHCTREARGACLGRVCPSCRRVCGVVLHRRERGARQLGLALLEAVAGV